MNLDCITEMHISWCSVQIVRFRYSYLDLTASLCRWDKSSDMKKLWHAEIAHYRPPYYAKNRDMIEETYGSLEEVSHWLANKLAEDYDIRWGDCL